MRLLADIAGARIGPGAALVVGGAGRLAGLLALALLDLKTLVVAAGAVDRGFVGAVSELDHAGAAHARDAAIVLHAGRHAALEPAHRADRGIDRVVEAPGMASPVALAEQRAILGIARGHRGRHVVGARPVE